MKNLENVRRHRERRKSLNWLAILGEWLFFPTMKSLQFDVWDSNNLQRKAIHFFFKFYFRSLFKLNNRRETSYKLTSDAQGRRNVKYFGVGHHLPPGSLIGIGLTKYYLICQINCGDKISTSSYVPAALHLHRLIRISCKVGSCEGECQWLFDKLRHRTDHQSSKLFFHKKKLIQFVAWMLLCYKLFVWQHFSK